MTDNNTRHYRILAVDDEQIILELYQNILCPNRECLAQPSSHVKEQPGAYASAPAFEVICCSQGDEAVEIVKQSVLENSPFALVFLDLNMPPGPDGEWTAEQIQKIDPYINIVLVTGYLSTNLGKHTAQSTRSNQLLYLQKPFHRQEIIQFANSLSAKWQAEIKLRALHAELEGLVEQRTADLQKSNEQLKIEVESRKQAQEALRMSEINFRNMINNNADGILILDKNRAVQFMNPAAGKMFGGSASQIPRGAFEYPVVADKTTELDIHCGNGKKIVAEMRVMETEWEGDKALLASLRDVTERKHMQQELQGSLDDLKKLMNGTIQAIALTVEMRDPYTSGHQQRVANLTRAVAEEMGLAYDQIEGIYTAAAIHDIGKISLPAEILAKPIQLTDIELRMIQSHSQVGYDILKGIEFPWPIAQVVLQHHERLDGSGYPDGLAGDDILMEARIIGVADVIETMASHRPYRPSMGMDKALEEITENRGLLYDPDVVDACVKVLTEKGFEFPKR